MANAFTRQRKIPPVVMTVLVIAITFILLLMLLDLVFPTAAPGFPPSKKAHAMNDVIQLKTAVIAYEVEYGAYPKGTPSEILTTLTGSNPKAIVFFEPNPKSIDPSGALTDPWGTPYHLDLTGPKPHIWSSGKNKTDDHASETSDDIRSWP